MEELETTTKSDHDLLIEVRVVLNALRADLKALSDNMRDRIVRLEESKLDAKVFTDFQGDYKAERSDKERRIRFLERWNWAAWGIVSFVEVIIGIYLAVHR